MLYLGIKPTFQMLKTSKYKFLIESLQSEIMSSLLAKSLFLGINPKFKNKSYFKLFFERVQKSIIML